MRVQSIGTAIEPRYPARNRFLGPAVEMALGKMDRVAELHYLAQEVRAMAEALSECRAFVGGLTWRAIRRRLGRLPPPHRDLR